jgi:hypothetical protein
MERLTDKIGNTNCVKGCGSNCKYGFQYCSKEDWENCETIADVIDKLADYEDLEEQCRLIKLPCKVGDKIFLDFAGFGKEVDKFTVKDFHLDCFKNGETILFCDYESNDRSLSGQIDVMEFGKTVFLTKSEAEAKLKELRGGE